MYSLGELKSNKEAKSDKAVTEWCLRASYHSVWFLTVLMTVRWQCCFCSLIFSSFFKCPLVLIGFVTLHITSAEVTAKAIRSHSRRSVEGPWFQTRWSMSCLSHSQTTSMSYSSLALMQTCWQTRTVCIIGLGVTEIWMPKGNSRELCPSC